MDGWMDVRINLNHINSFMECWYVISSYNSTSESNKIMTTKMIMFFITLFDHQLRICYISSFNIDIDDLLLLLFYEIKKKFRLKKAIKSNVHFSIFFLRKIHCILVSKSVLLHCFQIKTLRFF